MSVDRYAMSRFLSTGERGPLGYVRCKTGFAASRSRMLVHRVGEMASVRDRNGLRFGARWLCGGGAADIVAVADPNAHGGLCEMCEDVALGPVVYRCYDSAGRLLYVGSSGTGTLVRIRFHEKNASWWPEVSEVRREHFPHVEQARAAELVAIRDEQPVHNVQGRRRNRGAA